jgi:formylglycine-generating enzyme
MQARTVILLITVLSWTAAVAQDVFTNSIGIEFVLIKPGKMVVGKFEPPYPVPDDTIKNAKRPVTMWMGDGRGYNAAEFALAKKLAIGSYRAGFPVDIKKSFYIGRFEVTQGQWKKVMGSNPSAFKGLSNADSLPVESVTWEEAQKFISKLNKREKTKKYRLPTEFEWEYAARAGAADDIPWNEINPSAHLGKKTTQPVGGKKPNAWGLYDMLGNVWEWVNDCYNEKIFADPVPPLKGKEHVLKGASIAGDVKNATYMTHAAGPGNGWDVGFRIVMDLQPEKNPR